MFAGCRICMFTVVLVKFLRASNIRDENLVGFMASNLSSAELQKKLNQHASAFLFILHND